MTFYLIVLSCLLKLIQMVLSVAKSRASVGSIPYPFLIKGSAPYLPVVVADSPDLVPTSGHPFFNAILNIICYSLLKLGNSLLVYYEGKPMTQIFNP
jgi:hypothetical protein